MKLKHAIVVAVGFSIAAPAAFAQMKTEDAIKVRQAGYRFMAWNMGRIDASV